MLQSTYDYTGFLAMTDCSALHCDLGMGLDVQIVHSTSGDGETYSVGAGSESCNFPTQRLPPLENLGGKES